MMRSIELVLTEWFADDGVALRNRVGTPGVDHTLSPEGPLLIVIFLEQQVGRQ
jgi:hypothetical protein